MAAANHELDAPPWKRVESTLMATARAIRRAFDARYSHLELNVTQASLLAYLDARGPLSQTELASALGMGRAATGLVITALEKRGLVERRDNPDDRRAWQIALRPEGESLIPKVLDVDRVLRSELREGISRSERQQLAGLLLRLQSNLGRILDEEDA
jgi:DNA-binding MarR family transcriptional regulator